MRDNPARPTTPSDEPRPWSRWPHAMAWAVAGLAFPLIWLGGLVTTYEAGMAVPDWPWTYGYNPFLYPFENWFRVWDLFLEHSHRLLGSAVGLAAIGLVAALVYRDSRRGIWWLGVLTLLGVIFQGTLGGLRVLGNDNLLAMVHGCTAPALFGLAAAMVSLTSRRWVEGAVAVSADPAAGPGRLAVITTGLVYLQIMVGVQLRHKLLGFGPRWFELWVWLHLILAGLVLLAGIWVRRMVVRTTGQQRMLLVRANLLLLLLILQVLLGLLTWVTNYGLPVWFTDFIWSMTYTVVQEGTWQVWITTAHVAMGSLCLGAALSVAIWSGRLSSA